MLYKAFSVQSITNVIGQFNLWTAFDLLILDKRVETDFEMDEREESFFKEKVESLVIVEMKSTSSGAAGAAVAVRVIHHRPGQTID